MRRTVFGVEPLQIINFAFVPGWRLNFGRIARRVRPQIEIEDCSDIGLLALDGDRLPKRERRVVLHAVHRETFPSVRRSDSIVYVTSVKTLEMLGLSARTARCRAAAAGRPLVLLPSSWAPITAETDESFDGLVGAVIDSCPASHTGH